MFSEANPKPQLQKVQMDLWAIVQMPKQNVLNL
jgi:hypothetical protein